MINCSGVIKHCYFHDFEVAANPDIEEQMDAILSFDNAGYFPVQVSNNLICHFQGDSGNKIHISGIRMDIEFCNWPAFLRLITILLIA